MSVVMNFWIAIPVDDFFRYSNDIMKKYGVSAYVEVIDNKSGNRNVYTYREDRPNVFTEYFFEESYHSFYFSCYPFDDEKSSIPFGAFYTPEIAPFTIEGNGGYETESTREQIYLRQIDKRPDKNIKKFYSALQQKLKTLPGIQNGCVMGKYEYKNRYFLPSSKIIIPNNPHNKNIKGTWEDYYLNYQYNK